MSEQATTNENNRLMQMIAILTERVNLLENNKAVTDEYIRETVTFDSDSRTSIGTSPTTVVTSVDFNAKTTTTASISGLTAPTIFLRVYFRGKVYNVPAYAIS